MANVDSKFGLRPVSYINGSAWDGKVTWCVAPASYGTAIFLGDPVKLTGTGSADGVYPEINASSANSASHLGVAVAFRTDPPEGNATSLAGDASIPRQSYRPASTLGYVGVVTDPNVIFECQEDSVGGALATTSIGLNADLVAAAGSTTTGLSGWQIDSSTAATTTALDVKLLGIANKANGSNALGTNAVWRVVFNQHHFKAATTGL